MTDPTLHVGEGSTWRGVVAGPSVHLYRGDCHRGHALLSTDALADEFAGYLRTVPAPPAAPAERPDPLAELRAVAAEIEAVTEARREAGRRGPMAKPDTFVGDMPALTYELSLAKILNVARSLLAAQPPAPAERPDTWNELRDLVKHRWDNAEGRAEIGNARSDGAATAYSVIWHWMNEHDPAAAQPPAPPSGEAGEVVKRRLAEVANLLDIAHTRDENGMSGIAAGFVHQAIAHLAAPTPPSPAGDGGA